ncbi:unnamed protein product [Eruca vesicaria subsp. sativa]|uniref:COP9 signalosome complex subunit 7 n=1 Tax=Eruca vesicaria subsp. sativa TaxID=29727 RepID=A0ABC8JW50_ERUVS|nr:unnamed protein product [Eruca vesicaria subsp. sativa]
MEQKRRSLTSSFGEHLAATLEGSTHSVYVDVLRLFAHGTWGDYKCNASPIPQLSPDQILKLKQLTLLTLNCPLNTRFSFSPLLLFTFVLPYDTLMAELDVTNVRQLEDFLLNQCMYARLILTFAQIFQGIVRGNLDQFKRCFQVCFVSGRDLRPGQLGNMLPTLSNWLNTSENLIGSIQDKINWADNMSEIDKKHLKESEEVKKSLSMKGDIDSRGHKEMFGEPSGVMDYEEDRIRPKR